MISADVRRSAWHAAQAAVAARELPGPIPAADTSTLRPGRPGQYVSTLPYLLAGSATPPHRVAGVLAARLASLPWVAAATPADGHLTVTVTEEALAAVAVRIATIPDCARSDILHGLVLPAPPPRDLAAAANWRQAHEQVVAEATARLAAAAGAKIIYPERLPPGPSHVSQTSAAHSEPPQPGPVREPPGTAHPEPRSPPAGVSPPGEMPQRSRGNADDPNLSQSRRLRRSAGGPAGAQLAELQRFRGSADGADLPRPERFGGGAGGRADAQLTGPGRFRGSAEDADLRQPERFGGGAGSRADGQPPEPGRFRGSADDAGLPEPEPFGGGAGGPAGARSADPGRFRGSDGDLDPGVAAAEEPELAGPPGDGTVAAAVRYAGADAVRYALVRRVRGWGGDGDAGVPVRYHLDNPVYAVRYAHAHAASTLRQAADLGLGAGSAAGFAPCRLTHPAERALLAALSWLPERVAWAARARRPGEFARYLEEIAETYRDCREACPALPFGGRGAARDEPGIRARLWLVTATASALAAGLRLLGISAPERL